MIMAPKSPSLLQGTLDLIVLQLLRAEPTNGYELAQRIQAISPDVLNVNAGSCGAPFQALTADGSDDHAPDISQDSSTIRTSTPEFPISRMATLGLRSNRAAPAAPGFTTSRPSALVISGLCVWP